MTYLHPGLGIFGPNLLTNIIQYLTNQADFIDMHSRSCPEACQSGLVFWDVLVFWISMVFKIPWILLKIWESQNPGSSKSGKLKIRGTKNLGNENLETKNLGISRSRNLFTRFLDFTGLAGIGFIPFPGSLNTN